ncbi:MAG: hypothetical protein AB7P49_19210, partial [Bdellovibrionales bacterium]
DHLGFVASDVFNSICNKDLNRQCKKDFFVQISISGLNGPGGGPDCKKGKKGKYFSRFFLFGERRGPS